MNFIVKTVRNILQTQPNLKSQSIVFGMEFPKNMRLLWIFSIALVSMILITSQSPAAFAGEQGGASDPDGDNWFSTDNCPDVYNPGQEDVNDDGIGDACVPPSELAEELSTVVEETLVDIEDLSAGQINSIVGKLESAADKLDDGQLNAAIGSLNAFINQIEALINSGQLTAAEGDEMIAVVEMIIAEIE